ncbi:uncharacterized protein MYCGRDRAFT_39787 [Zymoseptoria tritici IPO323]|uniref:Uncharacterized protein n=1 Tax=Zymoseptoria tritici (strain CBS 115943 / IPO323) TaxID=336722 RepID=F9X760_ZYMTI|nr:uncharacterized protein MYCGRDRAFT_39787 [Zymoseptoria tritici IPO323]EGP89081.1 hypothetical protein MYCGRDRAFT_39787 [Zymoseptoria tritici IPO323]
MSYKVYRVAYAGMPRDHHAINVEQNDDESGWLFQVTGDIQNGMSHDDKATKRQRSRTSRLATRAKTSLGKSRLPTLTRSKAYAAPLRPPRSSSTRIPFFRSCLATAKRKKKDTKHTTLRIPQLSPT